MRYETSCHSSRKAGTVLAGGSSLKTSVIPHHRRAGTDEPPARRRRIVRFPTPIRDRQRTNVSKRNQCVCPAPLLRGAKYQEI